MNSTIKLKYDELETLKSLINLYMQSDGKVIENNWHNNNASTNIFHNEVIEISRFNHLQRGQGTLQGSKSHS